jgi:hypothetical protein
MKTAEKTVTVEGLTTEMAHIESIREQLFTPVVLQLHSNLEGFNTPGGFGCFKPDGGDALGYVGKQYSPADPHQLFGSLLEALIENGISLSGLRYTTMKDDRKIKFTIPVKKITFMNALGVEDTTTVNLTLQTGFDGWTSTVIYASTYRLICANGMKAIQTEFSSTFKNVKGNVGKVQAITEDVVRFIASMKDYEDNLVKLNDTKVSKVQIDRVLNKVFGMNRKDYLTWSSRKQNNFDAINKSVGLEIERTGQTAFGLMNGITHYTNHVASTKNREDYLFVDSGLEYNTKAQKEVYKIAKIAMN